MLWDHSRLYLIMDYVDLDLREHMDTNPDAFALENVKVPPELVKAASTCPPSEAIPTSTIANCKAARGTGWPCMCSEQVQRSRPCMQVLYGH